MPKGIQVLHDRVMRTTMTAAALIAQTQDRPNLSIHVQWIIFRRKMSKFKKVWPRI